MFSNNNNIESIGRIFLEFKKYIELQKDYIKWDTAEKLTLILSALLITIILILMGFIGLLFATFALAYYLGDTLHSLPLGFGIVAITVFLIALLFYFNRNRWVIQPLARFMTKLFINTSHDTKQQSTTDPQ